RRRGAGEIDAVGIDELLGMRRVAGERDGELLRRLEMAAARAQYVARQAEIRRAVGHARELAADRAGMAERVEHGEPRAGVAEARERHTGAEPLRDVARLVDAQQRERDAARTRPLQRGEAVAHLLKAGVEAAHQDLDIVA